MAEESRLFHESWYRIADQRISLRAGIRVKRRLFRGTRWYVLHDPFSNQFFRLRPHAYGFVSRLSVFKTVDEVWKETLDADPDDAPGQEEVIQLLAQLYYANLLHYDLPPDSTKLFERYKEQKQRETKATLMNIMFFRIPLFDPDAFLKRIMPIIKLLIGPIGAIAWIGVVVLGVKTAVENFGALSVQSHGILAPSNIPLLYLSLILIKAVHEFGHAFAVRRFGGEVHTMGVMFLIFNPLPYMDATAAWAFRERWKRVLVGGAGMVFEISIAACAALVWANTSPGVMHSLAYNMMFIASVSTVLFNINPLLRFDGYYILSDLIDIPNLHTQASHHLRHIVERYVFGYKKSTTPASSRSEAVWLTVFGILSGLYRIVVFTSILLFVADRLLIAGVIMAAVCFLAWIVAPLVRLVRYLATDPRLERTRIRAVTAVVLGAIGIVSVLYFIPMRNGFKAPGVLEADEHMIVANPVAGYVREIHVQSGTKVAAGTPLVRLENRDIQFRIREVESSRREVLAKRQRALLESRADVEPMNSLLEAIDSQLQRLYDDQERLVVTAPVDGVWVAPSADDLVGMWIKRGSPVGRLIDEGQYAFVSVISQEDTRWVFSNEVRNATVKLAGQAAATLQAPEYMIIPAEQVSLPSAALGYGAGGGVPIDVEDRSGLSAAEPFYVVRLLVDEAPGVMFFHGRSGRVRFELPPQPLLRQWLRMLRQLLQRRYQL